MKVNRGVARWMAIAGLLALSIPAAADGILAQMENEVAAIAQRAKSAVVTIEDSRALMVSYDTSPLERADIASRIARLQSDKVRQTQRLVAQEAQFRVGAIDAITIAEARDQAERIAVQLTAEQRKLEQFGRLSETQRQLQDSEETLALLNIDRRGAATALDYEDRLYKVGNTTQTTVDEARAKLEQVDQDIRAQTARRDLLRQSANGATNMRHTTALSTDTQRAYTTVLLQMQQADASANAPRSGTGFSIGEGYIVTTADVLEDMQNPVVITDAGTQIRARVLAVDPELNVGLVKLAAAADIPALRLGDSTRVMPGHFAISIGNQNGNNNSIALNMIASIRTEATYTGKHFYPTLIQIGGTVGAGTSGAPLLNSSGEVIGIMAGVPQAEPETRSLSFNAMPGNWTVNVPVVNLNYVGMADPRRAPQGHSSPTASNKNAGRGAHAATVHLGAKSISGRRTAVAQKGTNRKSGPTTSRKSAVEAHNSLPNGPNYLAYDLVTMNRVPNPTGAPTVRGVTYTWTGNAAFVPPTPAQPTPVVTSAGFAIPISEVQAMLADMKAGKPVAHGWIGVDLDSLERGTEKDGIVTVLRSVKIKSVYTGAPANRSGVLPGDLLVSLNDQPLHTSGDVRAGIVKTGIGKPLKLTIERNGQMQTLDVTVEARPAETGTLITGPPPPPAPPKGVGKTRPKGTSP